MHLEARGKNIQEEGRKKKPFNGKEKEKGGKWKGKKNESVKKEGEKTICKHCPKADMMKPTVGNYIPN